MVEKKLRKKEIMPVKNMKVSVGDLRIGEEEKKAINEVLNSGRITEDEKVNRFEREFAKYVGTKFSITVNSGTSALIAGLTALKNLKKGSIRAGTKVITSPITYVATSNSLLLTGFDPIYVDVDPVTFNVTPDNIKAHLESVDNLEEYSLILPVHLMGYPCDMDEINKIAKKYNLTTFEDAAQALGTIYKSKNAGSLSSLSAFSFYIAHNIQAGEMGAVATDDIEIWKLIKKIKTNGRMCDCPVCTRSQGKCPKIFEGNDEDSDPRFTHEIIGYNFKTMEFQAALALVQLKKADWIVEKRRENVKYLNEGLEKFSNVLQLPLYLDNVSYLAYPLIIKNSNISRKSIRYKLEKLRVETRPLFGCIPTQQPAFEHLRKMYKGRLPNAERIGVNGFYIGCHQYLEQDDLDYVIKSFREVLKAA